MTIIPRIAVVGGGLAGLAAASEAARAGLTVHLYDDRPALASVLAHRRSIPLDAVAPPSIRAPVTPVPIHAVATLPEE